MSDNTVIRYTKVVMISLHDSPLVQKPESMPSLSTWFGEDPNSPASKNILNGSIITRSTTEKGIILGPTKTNFASSLHGGLKRTEDGGLNQQHQQVLPSSRHNNRQLDNNRSPRGPSYIGEKGFSNRSSTLSENNNNNRKYNMDSPPKRNDRFMNNNNNNNARRGNRQQQQQQQQQQNHHHHNEEVERVPEWMDYTPEQELQPTTTQPTTTTILVSKEQDIQPQFANDLEAWKSNMKKRDGINTIEKKPSPPGVAVVEQQSQQQQGFFDDTTTTSTEQQPRNGGSRFAKFFAKREEPVVVVEEQQVRSITLNDLFQGPQQHAHPHPPHVMMQQQQHVQVFSEQDVLKSLGATTKEQQQQQQQQQQQSKGEDAIGFNRVLQILSQPKPSLSTNEELATTTTSPSLNNRFGNNLPTSVLRQMSTRASPSIVNNKATMGGYASPSNKQQHLPPHLQQMNIPPPPPPQQQPHYFQQQQQYQQQQPYSPNGPMMTFEQLVQFNSATQPLAPPPHFNRSNNTLLPHMMMSPSMMTPPLPPLHLQQQLMMQQRYSQQRGDMMIPPHMMANGMPPPPPPPQMFSKNQGWEQRP